ncbi:MAG: fructose-bisphosphatase class II [Thermoleophilaceae bacterium]
MSTYLESFAPSHALTKLRTLEPMAADATRAAAIASVQFAGRGDDKAADGAATEAMRAVLSHLPGTGTVVIGEGEKDEAPMLFNGERVGDGSTDPAIDIAVDPLECTDFCAAGLPGALTTIAFAEGGTMWSPGPGFYMDKLVVGPEARGRSTSTTRRSARSPAWPRRSGSRSRSCGCSCSRRSATKSSSKSCAGLAWPSPRRATVTSGALAALLADGDADLLMGIGGTPEGVMTACAVRALGGGMKGRLAPQSDEESKALADAGMDTKRALDVSDIVGGQAIFAATGVTGGALVRQPWDSDGQTMTETLLIAPGKVQRIVEAIVGQEWSPPPTGRVPTILRELVGAGPS